MMHFICFTIRASASCSSKSIFGDYSPTGILQKPRLRLAVLQRSQHKSNHEVSGHFESSAGGLSWPINPDTFMLLKKFS